MNAMPRKAGVATPRCGQSKSHPYNPPAVHVAAALTEDRHDR